MSESMSKIEEVARAIYQATPRNKPWRMLSAAKRQAYMIEARDAITEAYRPTDAMIEAASRARMNIQGGYGGPGFWEAARDAALGEEGW